MNNFCGNMSKRKPKTHEDYRLSICIGTIHILRKHFFHQPQQFNELFENFSSKKMKILSKYVEKEILFVLTKKIFMKN